MTRTLLVTNDFPPRPGGIQSYLAALVDQLVDTGAGDDLTVYAPAWRGAADHDRAAYERGWEVVRHPGTLMLPTPSVASRMRRLVADRGIDTVWFGAAAPLAILAGAARAAGAQRVVASTHGHEVGWSMVPGARSVLRRIGEDVDALTYVSRYTRGRFAAAFGPRAALEFLPPGVDTARFAPDAAARAEIRRRHGLGDRPLVVCVSRLVPRKGQDVLVRAMPAIRARVPDAACLVVGGGPHLDAVRTLARRCDVAKHVVFTGGVPAGELAAHHAAADVFAMPCRTRGGGLDVEGLGIVYLEASASGVPVVAGRSGGAPETVRDGETGVVVDGRSVEQVADAVAGLLIDRDRAAAMGDAGRRWVTGHWRWPEQGAQLRALLRGGQDA